MQFIQIKETCLYTENLNRAEKFYTEIIGLEKISSVEGRHVFFRAGTSVLLIFNPKETKAEQKLPPHFASGEIHFAFEINTENYAESLAKIKEKGVKIEHEQNWPGGKRSFYFRDPDNNLLEIVEKGIWDKI